ncbi:MAG: GNAT family N-acetyltransferase [Burkholderiales bacterium]
MNVVMSGVPSVRAFASHEWRSYRELRLRALAESPDAFGSTLALEEGRTDEDWSARLAHGMASGSDLPLVVEVSGKAVGLAWAKINESDHTVANLYQMWVSPSYRRMGAGRMLVCTAIDWARAANLQALILCVTSGDSPATRLYTSAGFKSVGAPEPLRPGCPLFPHTMKLEFNAGSA